MTALFFSCFFSLLAGGNGNEQQQKNVYIVHAAEPLMREAFVSESLRYHSTLMTVSPSPQLLYTYNHVIRGFAARLTAEEARLLQRRKDIIAVRPDILYRLHTTRTPEFLGLNDEGISAAINCESGSNVVIGMVDTGVWPNARSFNDDGIGILPEHWKGRCDDVAAPFCNRKLIREKELLEGYKAYVNRTENVTVIDLNGHGTHTMSTAAGSAVDGAEFFGYAKGTARGMASCARITAYKACTEAGCFTSDILSAIDSAMHDGVDVLSISIGGGLAVFYADVIAIGTFAAMKNGIFVSCSAGNDGPSSSTVTNFAPWVMTVGAATIDRGFPAHVVAGNGLTYPGTSLSTANFPETTSVGLIHARNAARRNKLGKYVAYCIDGSLDHRKVRGKVVMCERGITPRISKGAVVKAAGGHGLILGNRHSGDLVADPHILPAVAVNINTSAEIKKYMRSTPNATARLYFSRTRLNVRPSPVVAAFSSRGPAIRSLEIVKPDIVAPGVAILSAWPENVPPSGLINDNRRVRFNIDTGTSMSCPHISGLAALLKGRFPEWSPAAIRSALMTTAYVHDEGNADELISDDYTQKAATAFHQGSGHVNIIAALDPGLVYDLTVNDYYDFLCMKRFTEKQMKLLTGHEVKCGPKVYNHGDFNYPSFSVLFKNSENSKTTIQKHRRTLRNVGTPAHVEYLVHVARTPSVGIQVHLKVLTFSKLHEAKSYTVTFFGRSMPPNTTEFTRLSWSDGKHWVSSPIAFLWI